MKLHIAQHEGITYNCDQCENTHHYKYNLDVHTLQAHVRGGEKTFSCDQWDYNTKWKIHVREHKDSIHAGTIYSCDQNDFKANRASLLNRHIEVVHKGLNGI